MAKKTVAAKKRNVKVGANGQLQLQRTFNTIFECLANRACQVIISTPARKMAFTL